MLNSVIIVSFSSAWCVGFSFLYLHATSSPRSVFCLVFLVVFRTQQFIVINFLILTELFVPNLSFKLIIVQDLFLIVDFFHFLFVLLFIINLEVFVFLIIFITIVNGFNCVNVVITTLIHVFYSILIVLQILIWFVAHSFQHPQLLIKVDFNFILFAMFCQLIVFISPKFGIQLIVIIYLLLPIAIWKQVHFSALLLTFQPLF
jgi:hypothetical protein